LAAILARLPVQQDPNSHFAETLRNIRLALDLDLPGSGSRVIGLTSLRPGEGKTTVALNLAAVLAAGTAEADVLRPGPVAATGQSSSVLLIDADPRSPGLTRSLMPDPQRPRAGATAPGLVEVVSGRLPWTSALRAIAGTGIDFLGTRPTDMGVRQAGPRGFGLTASAILGSPRMAEIIAEARSTYRYVVIDLSPLGPLVDARMVIPHLDRVALIAEWGKLPKRMLEEAIATEPLLAARLLGVLLNKVDMKALRSYAGTAGTEQYFDEYRDYLLSGAHRSA
jgi:polysaccharide biosynthesis transport protein